MRTYIYMCVSVCFDSGGSAKEDVDPVDDENMDLINTYAGATPTRTPVG